MGKGRGEKSWLELLWAGVTWPAKLLVVEILGASSDGGHPVWGFSRAVTKV